MRIVSDFFKSHNQEIVIIFLILLLSIPLIYPFLQSGYFTTHDGEWAVVRLTDMFRQMKDFQIPARYSGNLNFSYGYPLFNFAYPFPYYLGLIPYLLGLGFVGSIKLLFAISVPASAILMYFAGKEIWDNRLSGFISSIVYIYLPYRMVDLYVRGSLGESISFVLFPLIILSISKLYKSGSHFWIAVGGIAYACLILSHNIMAVLFSIFFVFMVIFYFLQRRSQEFLKEVILLLLIGFGLSTFFWLPALIEKEMILLSKIPIANRSSYFVELSQFILPTWNYGDPSIKGTGFTYQLGWPFLLMNVLGLTYLINKLRTKSNRKNIYYRLGICLIFIWIFLTFFLFKESSPLWKLPLLREINFPWTMLSVIGLSTAVFSGLLLKERNLVIKVVVIVLLIVGIVSFLPYAKPFEKIDRGESFYLTNDATTTESRELMPLWVKKRPFARPSEKVELISGRGAVSVLENKSNRLVFKADLKENSVLRINTIYYPGWEVVENNKKYDINYQNEKGVMEIRALKGQHLISANFRETRLRSFSNLISISTVIFTVLFLIFQIKKNAKK